MIDSPFDYSTYATGRNFAGRRREVADLTDIVSAGEHAVIIGPPKSGKTSLIMQTVLQMKQTGGAPGVGECSLLTVRTPEALRDKFVSAAAKAVGVQESEAASFIGPDGMADVLRMPFKLASARQRKALIIIDDFQNLAYLGDGYLIFKIFDNVLKEYKEGGRLVSFVFCGSMVNAMKEIFMVRMDFYREVKTLQMGDVQERDIADYIHRGFNMTGKVIDNEDISWIYKTFRGNVWYINHFICICDSLTRGYINRGVISDAMSLMLSIHGPRYISMMNDLTPFQVSMLRAIIDGHRDQFSSTALIGQYGLNSSANVRRVKDALCKKEIITFDSKGQAVIIDPMFEYWVRTTFFGLK